MKDVATLVSAIDYKIRKLIAQLNLLRSENQSFRNEIIELRQENALQKHQIKQLEDHIKTLKLSKTLEIKEGNVDAKLKINELVREIDKCIGLLNT